MQNKAKALTWNDYRYKRDLMKRALLSVACFTASIANAATPIPGWYASLFGGYAYLPNNVQSYYGGVKRSDVGYWHGYDAGGNIGYKSEPMRYEGELTYLNANLKKFKINGVQQTQVGGYNNAILAMANAYLDVPKMGTLLQPFLGVGIGYAWIHAILNSQGPSSASTFTGQNTKFAYQGTAGLTYNFAENYALTLAYRYVATTKVDELGKIFQANLGNLGVVYRFDGNRYK